MDTASPYFLSKFDLLQKLRQCGYGEIAQILQNKDMDGNKLVRLKQIEVITWGLSHDKQESLFDFIEKYKRNPKILQVKTKPEVPAKNFRLQPHVARKTTVPCLKLKSVPNIPDPTSPSSSNFLTRKNLEEKKNDNKCKQVKKIDQRTPLPTPDICGDEKNSAPNSPNPEDAEYIDMNTPVCETKNIKKLIGTGKKPKITVPPRLPKFEESNKVLAPKPCLTSRSPSPNSSVSENKIHNKMTLRPKDANRTINLPFNRSAMNRSPSPSSIQAAKQCSKTIVKINANRSPRHSEPQHLDNNEDDVYENPDTIELLQKNPQTLTSISRRPLPLPIRDCGGSSIKQFTKDSENPNENVNFLPQDVYEPIEEENRVKNPQTLTLINKRPLPLPIRDCVDSSINQFTKDSENPNENVNFLPQDLYEPIEEENTAKSKKTGCEFIEPEFIESSDTEEESITSIDEKFEKSPDAIGIKEKRPSGFTKLFNKFKFSNKTKYEVYENVPQKVNPSSKTHANYDTTYKNRPLPELPTNDPSKKSVTNELSKSVSSVNIKQNIDNSLSILHSPANTDEEADTEEYYLQPKAVVPSFPENLKVEKQANSAGASNEPTSKQCDVRKQGSVTAISSLAAELQKKLAERKKNQKKAIDSNEENSEEENEFEPDPIYINEEEKTIKNLKQRNSYVMHFINPVPTNKSRPTTTDFSDNNEEIYVQAVSNVTSNAFYRETTKDGVKKYLEDLEDGAFLFRRGNTYPLVLAVKFDNRYYQMQIEKTKQNKFRLVEEDDECCIPEFSNLNEFVDYFTKEAIIFKSGSKTMEIVLKPILPRTRRF